MDYAFQYPEASLTVGAAIESVASHLAAAPLWYGHGTDNPDDEAAWLVVHMCGINYPIPDDAYAKPVTPQQLQCIDELLSRRITERQPLPYLLNEAWFAGLKFFVDERVLIPRSPFAELIAEGFQPWLGDIEPRRILEIGTGSGCIAIACALAFPDAEVVATDISPDALAVARQNVARHQLEDRVQLLEADLFNGVPGKFDLIVTNPPYVPVEAANNLPEEYNHEPVLALKSGNDGLDAARGILRDSAAHMQSHAILFLEVGAQWDALDRACPELPFMWLEFEHGGEGIAMIAAQSLVTANR